MLLLRFGIEEGYCELLITSERVTVLINDRRTQYFLHDMGCHLAGADEQELATPILSLCHGIFTD